MLILLHLQLRSTESKTIFFNDIYLSVVYAVIYSTKAWAKFNQILYLGKLLSHQVSCFFSITQNLRPAVTRKKHDVSILFKDPTAVSPKIPVCELTVKPKMFNQIFVRHLISIMSCCIVTVKCLFQSTMPVDIFTMVFSILYYVGTENS